MNNQKRVFIIAGEPSGDHHAAEYIKEHLKINTNIHFDAFGQSEIENTNAKIIYDTEKISVIGIIEVITRYKEILNFARESVRLISEKGRITNFGDS